MSWFYNLKISLKLTISFLVIALIAGVVGIVGLTSIMNIDEADTLLYEKNTLGIKYSGDAASYYQRLKYNTAEIILLKDDSLRNDYVKNLSTFIASIDDRLEKYEEEILSQGDQQIFSGLKSQWQEFKSHMQSAIQYIQNGEYDIAENTLLVDADKSGDAVRDYLVELVEYNEESAVERAEENTKLAASSITIMITIIIIGLIIAIILGLFIANIISKPIGKMVVAADKLAVGDLDVEADIYTKDEIGKLAESFRKLIESTREQALITERIADGDLTVDVAIRSEKDLLGRKLSKMVQELNNLMLNITSAAQQVSAGAKQISDSSIVLSEGSTEQASSIEELTASLEEMSSQTGRNAENANKANELTKAVKTKADQGNRQMKEMLNAMEEINVSSNNINRIIKVIDDIAFQTNILALNAAVEAARAGQYGKGFAVVAEEVRTLAAKSSDAAKETTELIMNSINKVNEGTKIASETAQSLNEIVEAIDRVYDLINEIATASNEQATGINQINQGIIQVSTVVQTNSSTAEENASASEELANQANLLQESVSRFKLKRIGRNTNNISKLSPEILDMIESMIKKNKDVNKHKDKSDEDIEPNIIYSTLYVLFACHNQVHL